MSTVFLRGFRDISFGETEAMVCWTDRGSMKIWDFRSKYSYAEAHFLQPRPAGSTPPAAYTKAPPPPSGFGMGPYTRENRGILGASLKVTGVEQADFLVGNFLRGILVPLF